MKEETFTDIEYTFRLYAMFTCANLYALAIAGRKLSTTCYRGSLPFFGKRSMNGCILRRFPTQAQKSACISAGNRIMLHDSEVPEFCCRLANSMDCQQSQWFDDFPLLC